MTDSQLSTLDNTKPLNTRQNYMHLRFLAKSAFDNATASVDNYIHLYDNLDGMNPAEMLLSDHTEFINRQTVCVGILAGELEVKVDGNLHVMKANSFNYIAEHSVVQASQASDHLAFFCFSVNHDLLIDVFKDMGLAFKMPSNYKRYVGREHTVAEMKYRLALYNELRDELHCVHPDYQKHIAQSYLCILFSNDFSLFEEELPDSNKAISRQHTLFRDFVDLLATYSDREREVQFYARQLGISSKYLSALCIEYSGKNASSWIDDYVITRVKALMQEHRYTIKEIAQVMNFPTQSFFGRYFKRVTGQSPRKYMIGKAL